MGFKENCFYIPVAPEDAFRYIFTCDGCDWGDKKYFQEEKNPPSLSKATPGRCPRCGSEVDIKKEDESKAPNISSEWDGPTVDSWSSEGKGCFTWGERQKTELDGGN